ncbi:hypothetical protein Aduo_012681 [Ancylostoma duodenale]
MSRHHMESVLQSLEVLRELVEEEGLTTRGWAYVGRKYATFLETRFRVFGEYWIARRPEGGTFSSYALDTGVAKQTVSDIVKEVTEAIILSCNEYLFIILLAICDCDYRILAFDIGAPGRAGDARVFRTSAITNFLERDDALFPATRNLKDVGAVQYHILVVAQGHHFIRPYTEAEDNLPDKRRFNQKPSGARQMIESTFGILPQRF